MASVELKGTTRITLRSGYMYWLYVLVIYVLVIDLSDRYERFQRGVCAQVTSVSDQRRINGEQHNRHRSTHPLFVLYGHLLACVRTTGNYVCDRCTCNTALFTAI
jgi:hypothetical protein